MVLILCMVRFGYKATLPTLSSFTITVAYPASSTNATYHSIGFPLQIKANYIKHNSLFLTKCDRLVGFK